VHKENEKNSKMQITQISFFVAAIGFIVLVAADKDSLKVVEKDFEKLQPNNSSTVTIACLRCMCECASSCDLEAKCDGNFCGPFRITKAFWIDSGRPTLKDETPGSSFGNFLYFNVEVLLDFLILIIKI
jgi:hypothetical protein